MSVNIMFLGDISLNNGYIKLAENGIDPFISVRKFLRESDLVIGNLECLLESQHGENKRKRPRLKTKVTTLNLMLNLGIKFVALANNHIADNLDDGVEKTMEFLSSNGIGSFGIKDNCAIDKSEYLELNIGGKKIAILNYVSIDTHPSLPEGFGFTPNIFDLERINSLIKSIRDSFNLIIAYLHWGGRVEGGRYPDWKQKHISHSIIDAGADIIIGHHPHVIQPLELYKTKHIYYSLGNFCFDDILSDGELYPLTERRKIGMIVKLHLDDTKLVSSEVFVRNENLRISLCPEFKKTFFRINMIHRILFKFKMLWWVYLFKHSYIDPIIDFFSRKDLSIVMKLKRFFSSIIRRIF